jgi:hypothetical protein
MPGGPVKELLGQLGRGARVSPSVDILSFAKKFSAKAEKFELFASMLNWCENLST